MTHDERLEHLQSLLGYCRSLAALPYSTWNLNTQALQEAIEILKAQAPERTKEKP